MSIPKKRLKSPLMVIIKGMFVRHFIRINDIQTTEKCNNWNFFGGPFLFPLLCEDLLYSSWLWNKKTYFRPQPAGGDVSPCRCLLSSLLVFQQSAAAGWILFIPTQPARVPPSSSSSGVCGAPLQRMAWMWPVRVSVPPRRQTAGLVFVSDSRSPSQLSSSFSLGFIDSAAASAPEAANEPRRRYL